MRLNTDLQLAKTLDLPFDIYTVTKQLHAGIPSFNLKGPIKIKSTRFSYNDKTKREVLDLFSNDEHQIFVKESAQFDDVMVFTTYDTAEDYMRLICTKKAESLC